MKHLLRAITASVLLAAGAASYAQPGFPSKPLKIVVPFGPGGNSDAVTRPLARAMAEILQQPVVVENKPGASGNIGMEYVAHSQPDGYTLLMGNISTNSINQTSYGDRLRIVPVNDLTAVSMVASTPAVLVAADSFPARTVQDFVRFARTNPGKVNYYLPGVGSAPHYELLKIEREAGIRMTGIPFSGGAGPGMTALLSGQVDIGLITLGAALPHLEAKKLKGLALTGSKRLADLPEVPTFLEVGLGSVSSSWQGLFVPAATPRPVVQKLYETIAAALARPDVKRALAQAASTPIGSTSPEDAQAFVVAETAKWAKVIKELGVKAE